MDPTEPLYQDAVYIGDSSGGVEVQPEKPYIHSGNDGESSLHLSHATLGLDCKGKQRTVVKCKVGGNPEVLLCSLIPGVSESCALDLLFDQDVAFTVSGASSVHLTGYNMPLEEPSDSDSDSDYDSDEYDTESGSETSDSMELLNDEDAEEDSEVEEVQRSSVRIEEVEEGDLPSTTFVRKEVLAIMDKPTKKRKNELLVTAKVNGSALKAHETNDDASMGEQDSEDEDGFALPGKKRGGKATEQIPKKKQAASSVDGFPTSSPSPMKTEEAGTPSDGKKKKKKKDKKAKSPSGKEEQVAKTPEAKVVGDAAATTSKTPVKTPTGKEAAKSPKKEASVIKKHPNGLEVQQLAIGKPNGKQAVPGKRVTMTYVGKLKSNGKIFDSNIGKKPFEFRLGVGEVIKGWDVGVNGMRVGDKRRLTIPPQMGYGAKGAGPIPGNAWLHFDVELVNVK